MIIQNWEECALAFLIPTLVWLREYFLRKKVEFQLSLSQEQNEKVAQLEEVLRKTQEELKEASVEQRVSYEKLTLLQNAQEDLKNVFRALSSEALQQNNQQFIELAKLSLETFQQGAKSDLEKRQTAICEMLNPMKESLQKLDTEIRQIEKERKGDQESLKEQVKSLIENEKLLKQETSNLVKALRMPLARGRWGEIQLKRVVELSGMLNHCDFFEQQQESSIDGRYRPDLIVRLPGGRQVIVDAKVPLEAYLEAVQAVTDGEKIEKLKAHARQVRAHVVSLGRKGYWEHFQPSPEFVILFLPAETFFSAALEYDPSLIEAGAEKKVIVATPTTLIALLRSVAYGWQQENLTHHVEALHQLGKELYKRLADMGSHFTKIGRSLGSAVEAYNKAMGSLETRVFVTARKFNEMKGLSGQVDLESMELIEKIPRQPSVSESESVIVGSELVDEVGRDSSL